MKFAIDFKKQHFQKFINFLKCVKTNMNEYVDQIFLNFYDNFLEVSFHYSVENSSTGPNMAPVFFLTYSLIQGFNIEKYTFETNKKNPDQNQRKCIQMLILKADFDKLLDDFPVLNHDEYNLKARYVKAIPNLNKKENEDLESDNNFLYFQYENKQSLLNWSRYKIQVSSKFLAIDRNICEEYLTYSRAKNLLDIFKYYAVKTSYFFEKKLREDTFNHYVILKISPFHIKLLLDPYLYYSDRIQFINNCSDYLHYKVEINTFLHCFQERLPIGHIGQVKFTNDKIVFSYEVRTEIQSESNSEFRSLQYGSFSLNAALISQENLEEVLNINMV